MEAVKGELGQPVLVIEAGKGERQYWRDILRYRELFFFLAWRDVLVRYKQTVIGIAWALVRPFLTIVVFTVIFGKVAAMPSEGVPYPLLVCAGLLPWQFFSSAMTEASMSLVGNANVITKIYFPRLVIPTSAVVVSLVDFLISFVIFVGLMVWYRFVPPWSVLFLPVFTLLTFGASMGGGLWLAALTVKYRDFRYIVPFIVQFGVYISPVGFSSQAIPERWQLLYSLNPMVGVIDVFRWSMLGTQAFPWVSFAFSALSVALLVGTGIVYFRRTERGFADII